MTFASRGPSCVVTLAGCLQLLSWCAAPLQSQEYRRGDPLPQQVRDDWQSWADAYRSVYWKVEFEETLPPGYLEPLPDGSPFPAGDTVRNRAWTIWIDFRNQRWRMEEDRVNWPGNRPDGSSFLQTASDVSTFDGERTQTRTRLDDIPEHFVSLVLFREGEPPVTDGTMIPILAAHGANCSKDSNHIFAELVRLPPDSDWKVQSFHSDDSGRRLTLRATDQRTPGTSYMEMIANLDRGSTVERYDYYNPDGTLWSRTEITWEQSNSLWRPTGWNYTVHSGPNGQLLLSGRTTSVRWEENPNLASIEFHQTPKPGERYHDREKDEVFVHLGGDRPDVPSAVFRVEEQSRQARARWWWLAGLVAACAAVCAVWRRRSRGLV